MLGIQVPRPTHWTLSCRPGNFTSMALAVSVNELRRAGTEVQIFDAGKLKLDFPGSAPTADSLALTKAVAESSGVIIATPEYHVRQLGVVFRCDACLLHCPLH